MAQVVAQGSPRMPTVSVCDNYSYTRVEAEQSIALNLAPALADTADLAPLSQIHPSTHCGTFA